MLLSSFPWEITLPVNWLSRSIQLLWVSKLSCEETLKPCAWMQNLHLQHFCKESSIQFLHPIRSCSLLHLSCCPIFRIVCALVKFHPSLAYFHCHQLVIAVIVLTSVIFDIIVIIISVKAAILFEYQKATFLFLLLFVTYYLHLLKKWSFFLTHTLLLF